MEKFLAKVRPQIALIITVVGVLAYVAITSEDADVKGILSLVVIAIVALGKDLIQLEKDSKDSED